MKVQISFLSFVFLLAFGSGSVHAQSRSPQLERLLKADTNEDGKISSEEAPARMKQNFARLDSNGDGFLDQTELEALAERMSSRTGNSQNNNSGGGRAAGPVPEGVTVKKDIAYREGNPMWVLDLYLPEGAAPEGGRPGLVVVHGGGWKNGDKAGGMWSSIPAGYAAKGYVAIGVNYRMYPEVGMLDCIADVKCAVRWLRAHAEEYGLDSDRIGAYGNSAGAHLVSILGLTSKEAGLEGDGPYKDVSSQVQAVCASATPADFIHWSSNQPASIPALTQGGGEMEENAKKASPVTYVSKDAPPFLLVHAKDDRTVPYQQGRDLSEKLKAAGADVTLMSYDDGGHGVFGAKQKETHPAMAEFFDRVLRKK